MELTLLSAIPCSRVDLMPCCKDGRGGWVYSQSDPSRCFTNFDDKCRLFFALSIFASENDSDDNLESTKLIATMGESEIGTSTLEWGQNNWGIHLDHGAIYSWPQSITIEPPTDGLIEVQISVNLRSKREAIAVAQKAYCHVRQEDRDAMQQSPFRYFLSRLRRKAKTFR
jgi:hypothetical protein